MKNLTYILAVLVFCGCSVAKTEDKNVVLMDGRKENKYINAYNETLKTWPVPYQEVDVPTSFGTAHVIITGPENGEPLVLLHGMDASSTMWYPNIKAYSKNHRVYAIDYLLEAGKSEATVKGLTTEEMCTWYNEIFKYLNLKDINLVGNSRGGWLATNYTVHNLGNVKRLILLAPVQTFNNISMGSDTKDAANFKFFPNRRNLDALISSFTRYPEKITPEFKEQVYLGTKYSKSSFDMLEMKPFTDEELMSLTIPVLVLVGDYDILTPATIIEKAGRLLPNVEAALIEDSAHFLTIDKQEEVDARVLEFLSKEVEEPIKL